jgi:hypothetical protein
MTRTSIRHCFCVATSLGLKLRQYKESDILTFRILPVAVLLAGMASGAWARNDPTPPPSGIVIHVFGPNSLMSNILPDGAAGGGAEPAAGSGGAKPAAGGTSMAAGSPSGTAAAQNYPEPTMDQVLHQMFVTGDPNQKPGAALATGRTGTHP